MFDHFLVSVVVAPPVIVALVRLVAGRIAPARSAVVLAWSAAVVAGSSVVNLAVFAVVAAAEVPAVGRAFGWSTRVVAADTARVPWVVWLSVVLLVAAGVSVGRRWRMHRRTLARARDQFPSSDGLLVVADGSPQAFAVPGRPGHVVVTTGMRDLLSARHLDALLAHERAHLAGRHHRLVLLADLAAAAHPALRWVARQVDYLVERAADEAAAVRTGSRRTVAEAIGRAALASTRSAHGLNAATPGGVVPRRVAALLRPGAGMNLWVLGALPAGLAAFTLAWTGEAVYDLVELLTLAAR
jgi:Zn-dependent protease with chaperone function